MARYFQATQQGFLDDAMYQHPTELMAQALQAKDQEVDSFLDEIKALEEVDIIRNKKDNDSALAIRDQMDNRVNSLTEEAMGDLTNVGRYNMKIKDLQRDLNRSVKEGDIFKLKENKEAIDADVKENERLYKLDPSKYRGVNDISEIRGYVEDRYEGFKDEEGSYRDPQGLSLVGTKTSGEIVDDIFAKNTKMDYSYIRGRSRGYNRQLDRKGFTPAEISSSIKSFVESDENIQKAIQQQVDFSNYRDKDSTNYKQEEQKIIQELQKVAQSKYAENIVVDKLITSPLADPSSSGGGENPSPAVLSEDGNLLIKNPAFNLNTNLGLSTDKLKQDSVPQEEMLTERNNRLTTHFQDRNNQIYSGLQTKFNADGVLPKGITMGNEGKFVNSEGNTVPLSEAIVGISATSQPAYISMYNTAQKQLKANEILENSYKEMGLAKFDNISSSKNTTVNMEFQRGGKLITEKDADLFDEHFSSTSGNAQILLSSFESQPIGTNNYMTVQRTGETVEQAKERMAKQLGTAYKEKSTFISVITGYEDLADRGYVTLNSISDQMQVMQKLTAKTKSKKELTDLEKLFQGQVNNDLEKVKSDIASEEGESYLKNLEKQLKDVTNEDIEANLSFKQPDYEVDNSMFPTTYVPDSPYIVKATVTFKSEGRQQQLDYIFNGETGPMIEKVKHLQEQRRQLFQHAELVKQGFGGRLIEDDNTFSAEIMDFEDKSGTKYTIKDGRLYGNDRMITDEEEALIVLGKYIAYSTED
jgi:hypothetical protein